MSPRAGSARGLMLATHPLGGGRAFKLISRNPSRIERRPMAPLVDGNSSSNARITDLLLP